MSNIKDIEIMIQALTMTIAIHEREEAFFRRSAELSASADPRNLFLEIAEEMKEHVAKLMEKKNKLLNGQDASKKNNHKPG
jgi:rubrerythrin